MIENQSIFYLQSIANESSIFYFEISLVLLILCFAATYISLQKNNNILLRKIISVDVLLPAAFAVATCLIYRNLPLFALSLVIPLTKTIPALFEELNTFLHKFTGKNNAKLLKNYMLGIFCLLLIGQIGRIIWLQPPGLGVIDNGKQTVDFFINKLLPQPIYNNFDIGGYLAYRLYPQKVFIDNRPEAYPKEFAEKAYFSTHDPKDFADLDKKYSFNTVIFSHWDRTPWKNELLSSLLKNPNYTLIYLDDYATIFVKNNEKNKQFIANKITDKNFVLAQNLTAEQLVRYIYFFEKAGWKNQEKKAYNEMRKVDPGGFVLKRYLSAVKEGNNLEVIKKN